MPIQILPKIESFGERMGRSLGEGLGAAGVGLAQGLADRHQNKKRVQYFDELAKKHPDDPTYQMMSEIASSPLGENQQNAFVKAILGHRENPFLQKQQDRLDRDSMAKLYNQKIRELDDDLKYGDYTVDKDALRAQKQQLQQQRDLLFEGLKGSKYDFDELDDHSDMESTESPSSEDEEDYPKVVFDFKNKKHIAVRDKAIKMAKGDRKKAEAILRKRFKL